MSSTEQPWEISCRDVKQRLDEGRPMLLIDCRERSEFEIVRIDGAVLVPMSELTQRIAELTPHQDVEIVVHCHHGGRSLRAAQWLRRNGFSRAQSMSGGIHHWATEVEPHLPKY